MKKFRKGDKELKQYSKPYFSTIQFEEFLNKELSKCQTIIDIGCYTGGTLSYYCKKYNNIEFIGIDYDPNFIKDAKKYHQKNNIKNSSFYVMDLINDNFEKKFHSLKKPIGIISEKTFCTFKRIDKITKKIMNLNCEFLAINSLFYNGDIDALIHIREPGDKSDNDPNGDLNIHSLNKFRNYLNKNNYTIRKVKDFFPPKKILSKNNGRGTYTMKTEISDYTMFSGPIFLPWKFVLIKNKKKL